MTNQPSDQNIVITYVLKADESITKAKELRERVDQVKAKIKELAASSGADLKTVARSMKETAQTKMDEEVKKLRDQIAQLKSDYKGLATTEVQEKEDNLRAQRDKTSAIQQLRKETQGYKQDISQATAELSKGAGGAGGGGLGGLLSGLLGKGGGGGLGGILSGLGGGLAALASSLLPIIGVIFGITSAVSLLRKALDFLAQATDQAKDFAQAVFSMTVGIRALQRVGVNITMKDMATQLENLKKKFGIFAMTDLVQGAAAFVNLNRDMGLTEEQLFKLQDAIATLAVVNGRSMDEVQRTVALALASGYTEGLQRLGVSINRVVIAEEAARLGWKGGYTSLTEQQRALATYNLVIKKTNVYMNDLLEYQKTTPGKIDKATAAIKDETTAIGDLYLGLKLFGVQAKETSISIIRSIMQLFALKTQATFQRAYLEAMEEMEGRTLTFGETIKYTFVSAWKYIENVFSKTPLKLEEMTVRIGLPDVELTEMDRLKLEKDQIQRIVEGHLDELIALQEDFEDTSKDLQKDYDKDVLSMAKENYNNLVDLAEEHNKNMVEIEIEKNNAIRDLEIENAQRLADIQKDYERSVEDAKIKYDNDLAQTWTDYYNKVIDAQAKYENQQWKAEQDFQEKMRRLKEGFLFNLEDAIRERDARQVMQLIRRYKLDKDQLQREYEQTKEQNKRNFELQMQDLARQRDERLALLYTELEARLKALELEATRERDDQLLKYGQEMGDIMKNYQDKKSAEEADYALRQIAEAERYSQERADRLARFEQDKIDLRDRIDADLKEIATAFATQITLTDTSLATLEQVLRDTLGEGGVAEGIINYYKQMLSQLSAFPALQNFLLPLPNAQLPNATLPPAPQNPLRNPIQPPVTNPFSPYRWWQKGGWMLANKPTNVTFGEGGLEMAQFTPLTRPMTNPSFAYNLGGMETGATGKVAIEIWLSKYLEASIIDKAADSLADVVIKRLR